MAAAPDALAALIAERRLAWYALARRIVGDPAAAEDCLHDALLLAWRHRGDLRDPGAAEAWVRRIVTRVAMAHQGARFASLSDETAASTATEDIALNRWTAAQAVALIEALPPRQRHAVLARLIDDQPYESVAERLGCTDTTARSLVRFGLAAVRPRLRRLAA